MKNLKTISDVRHRFSELMAESYFCIHKRDVPNGILMRTQINEFLGYYFHTLRPGSVTKMKRALFRVKLELSLMINRESKSV